MTIKASDAKQLLENPIFDEMFDNVREGIVTQIEMCPLDNDLYKNQLMLSLQLLVSLREEILDMVNTGYLDESEQKGVSLN